MRLPVPDGPPWKASLGVAGVALAVGLALTAVMGVPKPETHDEVSYLLAADTFAHGRLANPTPPGWEHLETFHELFQPTYASKYPPGQGALLALGQLTTGQPFVGVLIGMAAFCGAVSWMLFALVSPGWAVIGGLVTLLHFGITGYWVRSYWGGALAAAGGALAIGAVARLVRREPRASWSATLGVGLSVLFLTRPWEGLWVGLVLCAWLASSLLSARRASRPAVLRASFLLPLGAVLAITAAGTALYDQRVTGNPWRLPYQLHQEQYAVVPALAFLPRPAAPVFHNEPIAKLAAEWERDEYVRHRAVGSWLEMVVERALRVSAFLFGPFLWVPLLALPLAWREPSTWWLVAVVGANVLATMLSVFAFPHYLAPATPALLGLVVVSLHALDSRVAIRLRKGDGEGRALPVARWAVVLLAAALVAGATVEDVREFVQRRIPWRWSNVRAAIERDLAARGGRSLVLVDYGPAHSIHEEWVWNGADPASAPVLWARSRGPADDAAFRALWPDRDCYLLHVEGAPPGVRAPVPALAPCPPSTP